MAFYLVGILYLAGIKFFPSPTLFFSIEAGMDFFPILKPFHVVILAVRGRDNRILCQHLLKSRDP